MSHSAGRVTQAVVAGCHRFGSMFGARVRDSWEEGDRAKGGCETRVMRCAAAGRPGCMVWLVSLGFEGRLKWK